MLPVRFMGPPPVGALGKPSESVEGGKRAAASRDALGAAVGRVQSNGRSMAPASRGWLLWKGALCATSQWHANGAGSWLPLPHLCTAAPTPAPPAGRPHKAGSPCCPAGWSKERKIEKGSVMQGGSYVRCCMHFMLMGSTAACMQPFNATFRQLLNNPPRHPPQAGW